MSLDQNQLVKVNFDNIQDYQGYLATLKVTIEQAVYNLQDSEVKFKDLIDYRAKSGPIDEHETFKTYITELTKVYNAVCDMEYAANTYVNYYTELGTYENGELVYDEATVDSVVTNFQTIIDDPDWSQGLTKNSIGFEVWENSIAAGVDFIDSDREKAVRYNRGILDDLNVDLIPMVTTLRDTGDDLTSRESVYKKNLQPLADGVTVNAILDSFDIEEVDYEILKSGTEIFGDVVSGNYDDAIKKLIASMSYNSYGQTPNVDDLPENIKVFLNDNGLSLEDFVVTEDGFITCTVPIDELDILADFDEWADLDNGMLGSDWYIYGVIDSTGDYTYSLYKLKQNSVACSFIEVQFDENGKISENSFYQSALGSNDAKATKVLTDYFGDKYTQGNFVLSDLQIQHEMAAGYMDDEKGVFRVDVTYPENRVEIDLSKEILKEDKKGNYVEIKDPDNISVAEYNTLLYLTTGDSSPYAFAQENIYHSKNAYGIPYSEQFELLRRKAAQIASNPRNYDLPVNSDMPIINLVNDKAAESGKIMNAGLDESSRLTESLYSSFHNPDSPQIAELKEIHDIESPNKN